jgi:hypothetical protein
MAGNNKADALRWETDLERHDEKWRQRNIFSNPDNSTRLGHL